jgi:branched-chain amino acid transport system substrate-binding protein
MVIKGMLRRSSLAILLSGAVAVTACSSSSKSTTGATTPGSTKSSSSDLLGPSKPASGTPVKIGFASDGKSVAVDNSSETPAAQATAKYINEHLGGIAGHPIELDTCDTKDTPAGSTDCGNQFIADKVAAVLVTVSGASASLFKAVNAGNLPYVEHEAADSAIVAGKNAYVLTNSLSNFVGPPKMAQNSGAKRAAVIAIDVPGVTEPLKTLGGAFYKNAGVTLDVVPVPPGTPDMTPQMQVELSKNPEQIQVIGNAAFCTSALKAMKTLGYSKSIIVISQCVSPSGVSSIPGGYSGMKEATVTSSDPADPDVKLFKAVMSTYAPGAQIVDTTPGAFSTVLGFAHAMSGLTGDVTPASVQTAFQTMSPQPLPLSGGATFQCNGKQISFAPAVCATGVLEATLDTSGSTTGGFKPLDVSSLLKLG